MSRNRLSISSGKYILLVYKICLMGPDMAWYNINKYSSPYVGSNSRKGKLKPYVLNWFYGKESLIFVSERTKISTLSMSRDFSVSNFYPMEFTFKCPIIYLSGCFCRKFPRQFGGFTLVSTIICRVQIITNMIYLGDIELFPRIRHPGPLLWFILRISMLREG